MENHSCKGCYILISDLMDCPHQAINEVGNCPCRICLIKGICNTTCEEYNDFFNELAYRSYDKADIIS